MRAGIGYNDDGAMISGELRQSFEALWSLGNSPIAAVADTYAKPALAKLIELPGGVMARLLIGLAALSLCVPHALARGAAQPVTFHKVTAKKTIHREIDR
ncbi:hypothetical protein AMST5_01300 [freshwater sediment metagenome]|uniref:Uncharacterized protein n=1 Tax=freshwater sediment metagenome TaxID=556182 RepID=A0AA48R9F3_9ZZZZ